MEAETRLADSYLFGKGNEVNRDAALRWYVKASKQGDKEAADMLKTYFDSYYIVISYPSESLKNEIEYETKNADIYESENIDKKYTFNIEFCNMPIQNYHVKFKIINETGGVMLNERQFVPESDRIPAPYTIAAKYFWKINF